MELHFTHMMALCQRLTRALALALRVPPSHFDAVTRDPMASLRLTHYPPQLPHTISDGHLGAARTPTMGC